MNTEDLTKAIRSNVKSVSLSYRQSEEIVRTIFTNIKEAVEAGEDVMIRGLLSVRTVERKARTHPTPQGGTVFKPAHTLPVVKLTPSLVKKATKVV